MRHTDRWTGWIWLTLAGLLALTPCPAVAEGFFDLYIGAGFPQDSDVDTSADDFDVAADIAYNRDVDWETTPSLGLRGGYWFDEPGFNFLGIGLDLSYYRAFEDTSFAELDVYAVPLTPLLMLRIPIASSERFPGGRIQPYAAVGPGFTLSAARADLSEIPPTVDTRFEDFEAGSFDVGLDARAGLAIQLAPPFAIFGEYRFTYLEPEFEDEIDVLGPGIFEAEVDIEPELETHHLVFGVSFRF